MSKRKISRVEKYDLQTATIRVSRTGFAFIGVFLMTTVIFDSWNLLTKVSIGRRWASAVAVLVVTAGVWYLARRKSSDSYYNTLIMTLVISQIIFAGFNIYWQRGIASALPILFIIPILTAGAMKKRTTLLFAAILSAAVYSTAAVVYFNENYGEGYRVQLWGQIFFFGGLFFVVAWLAMILAGLRHDSK